MTGAAAIVHCATDPRDPAVVDVAGTERLLAAAGRSGRPHVVYISIAGVDRIPWDYYRAKLAAERSIVDSGLPWTILRTTQFHEFTLDLLRRAGRLPVVPVPRGWHLQPVDADEVADRLAESVAAGPGHRLDDLRGPQVLPMAEVVRRYLESTGRHRPVVAIPVPGAFSAAMRQGAILRPGTGPAAVPGRSSSPAGPGSASRKPRPSQRPRPEWSARHSGRCARRPAPDVPRRVRGGRRRSYGRRSAKVRPCSASAAARMPIAFGPTPCMARRSSRR